MNAVIKRVKVSPAELALCGGGGAVTASSRDGVESNRFRHKGTGTLANCTLGELGVLGANPFRGGEETRAKDAKDAEVKGMKDDGVILDLSLYLPLAGESFGIPSIFP